VPPISHVARTPGIFFEDHLTADYYIGNRLWKVRLEVEVGRPGKGLLQLRKR
jgi:hypothetical protein